jgi:hypothetical protein
MIFYLGYRAGWPFLERNPIMPRMASIVYMGSEGEFAGIEE